MSKKQVILYIVVGIVVVILYSIFFGNDQPTEKDKQDAIVEDILKDQGLYEDSSTSKGAKVDPRTLALEKEIEQYTKEIDKGNDLDIWYYKRAQANEELTWHRAAINDYSKALEINPKSANVYFNRGLLYEKMGLLDAALADYQQAIDIKPEEARLYNTRALAYADKGQFQKALADYNKAIELDPNYAPAYYNRGTLFERQDELKNAYADYTKAIELHTENDELSDSHYRRAIVSYSTGDFKAALADADQAIKLDPKSVKAFQLRSSVYEKLGNVAAAANDDATAQTLSLEHLLPGKQSE